MAVLRTAFDLLSGVPEGEAELLELLVSKLGDREGKVASLSQRLCLRLVAPGAHEAMRPVVARALRQFLHHPALTPGGRPPLLHHSHPTPTGPGP